MLDVSVDRGYVARDATVDDAPAIAAVLAVSFPAWPRIERSESVLEHIRWKVASPEQSPERPVVVTLYGEVVALQLRWLARATLNGEAIPTEQGVDFAVRPEHQGQGVSRLLLDHAQAARGERAALGLDLISKSDAVRHIYADHATVTRTLQAWRRPLSARAFLSHHRRGGFPQLSRSLRGTGPNTGAAQPVADLRVESLDCFDQRADSLWDVVGRQFAFARVRDAAYLNWRHVDPRSGQRAIFGAFDRDDLVGWSVFRPHEGTLRVADLVVHPDHPAAGAALLAEAVRCGREAGARELVTWLPAGHRDEVTYRAAGFAPVGKPFTLQIWPMSGGGLPFAMLQPLADRSVPIHITMTDFDFA